MTQAANLGALGTNAGTTGILPAAGGGTAGTAGVTGFKNRIINGAMVISQRGTSFSFVNGNTSVYTLDRWRCDDMVDASFTISQSSDAPAGFINSLLVTTSSGDSSIGTNQYSIVQQQIEANNVNDLNWGTANAKTVTLSFWVKSSLTGTFGGCIRDNAATYSFPFSYTISAANTWTQASVTISGPTSGSFSGTNGLAFTVFFSLGTGSGLSAAANSWIAGNYVSSTAAAGTGVAGTTGATWYVTGVQLEVGSAATNFDVRSIGTELGLCQRYFAKIGLTSGEALGMGMTQDSYSSGYFYIKYPVTMRAAATLAYNYIGVTDNANGTALATSIRGQSSGKDASNLGLNWTNPGWTVFYNPMMVIAADATGYISMSAEL